MRCATLLTITILFFLAGGVSVPAFASAMPWEKREAVVAIPVPLPGTPEWNAIFPKGLTFDPPPGRANTKRAQVQAIPLERFDRLRIRSDGKAASEIDYLTNVVQSLLTTSTDDVLRNPNGTMSRVNYDERLRFFLEQAWKEYELYLSTQKNRLNVRLPKNKQAQLLGLRVTAELTPATRHITFANGRGTFAAEGWLSDGIYGEAERIAPFLLKLEFITDRASPDIIISKWEITIREQK